MIEIRISYPEDTMQRIANYLATRPYGEVFQLLNEIQMRGAKVEAPLTTQTAANYAADEHNLT